MGFRSTLVSQAYGGETPMLPSWFVEKYESSLINPSGILIVSRWEAKYYDNTVFEDYRQALNEIGFFEKYKSVGAVTICVLGEDRFVSKVDVYKDSIEYSWLCEPNEAKGVWKQEPEIDIDYTEIWSAV